VLGTIGSRVGSVDLQTRFRGKKPQAPPDGAAAVRLLFSARGACQGGGGIG